MQSLVLMTVLSGAVNAPEQYWAYPCGYAYYYGPAYYGPAYYYRVAAAPVYAEAAPSTRKKLEDLSAQIARINERLESAEFRFRTMEAKHREMEIQHQEMAAKHKEIAAGLKHTFEEHARHMEKMMEARIKEERVRQELIALREKTRDLETSDKTLKMIRLENIHEHLAKLENQIRKLESTVTGNQPHTGTGNQPHTNKTVGNRGPEANFTFEASEDLAAGEVPDNRAMIIVNLPERAKLYVNGQLRKGSSGQRFILTPQLEDGDYYYTLRIDVERDGRNVSQTRQVSFRRGQQVRVNIENPGQ
jgi:uncharacterized protein (TIGR03000 family)